MILGVLRLVLVQVVVVVVALDLVIPLQTLILARRGLGSLPTH